MFKTKSSIMIVRKFNKTSYVVGILLFLTFYTASVNAQLISSERLSDRNANYDITVSLDTESKILTGNQTLTWINTSSDTIRTLQFHLYLNAFKNTESTFMKESGGQLRGDTADKNDSTVWGWIDVKNMRIKDGTELTEIRFIQPDDENEKDQTVIEVVLPNPILGGETIVLEMDFISKLPKIFARTGYGVNNYYFVGQWFPKIGVWETAGMRYSKKGAWNCHQFHGNSEFYADFGEYNVEITIPENFVLGASGQLQDEKTNSDSTKTYTYKALDVIDFAWTASPQYLDIRDKWQDTDIKLLLMPEHLGVKDRYLKSAKEGLEYFDNNVGPYPYTTLTVVDPPLHSAGAGGMEYPTLITGGSIYNLSDGIRLVEMVTIHEFGHQYFMGMLASNEFEEPWLDEGFNTYLENRTMDFYFGGNTSFMNFGGINIGDGEMSREGYLGMSNPKIAENFRPSWEFQHGGYGSLTYNKTGVWMTTLEGIVGIETMDRIMKTYFNRWSFKHPCATDFIAIVNEIVTEDHGDKFGTNMQWYFDQVLYDTKICDYSVAQISNTKIVLPSGVYDMEKEKVYNHGKVDEDKADENETEVNYTCTVIVNRLGELVVPQKVKITFANGDEVLEEWNGKARSYEFKYVRAEKIIKAEIDPDHIILMDINMINNSKVVKKEKDVVWKYFSKVMMSFQSIFHLFSILA